MVNFEVDARTIFQIGKESIEDVKLAISEIVKNAYDADATTCYIYFEEIEKNITKVIFKDDGYGMDILTLQNYWLRIGTSNKQKNPLTSKGRRKIGEKGIGRFALNRIGNLIEIYSKSEGKRPVYMKIDFNLFVEGKNLVDIPVVINEITDKVAEEQDIYNTGTKIIVSDLNDIWDAKLIKKIEVEISKLVAQNKLYSLDKFNKITYLKADEANQNFNIEFKYNDMLKNKDIDKIQRFLEFSLFRMTAKINTKDMTLSYKYSFHPYDLMGNKIESELIEKKDGKLRDPDQKGFSVLLPTISLGEIEIEFFAYDFSALVNRYSPLRNITPLKEVVRENGGVKVYRDSHRVYNYGESGTDWLELDAKRVNRPGKYLSNNVLIGNVYLQRNETLKLVEKTNREGFVKNEEFDCLKKIVQSVVNEFSYLTEERKFKIKKYLGEVVKTVSYDDTIEDLVLTIESLEGINVEVKADIKEGIFLVKAQMDYIKNIMLNTSVKTMDYLTMMHDLEKNVDFLFELIQAKPTSEIDSEIIERVIFIKQMVKNQNDLIRDKKKQKYNLNDLIDEIVFRKRFTFKRSNIDFTVELEKTKNIEVLVNRSSMIRVFDNIIDNSIYWYDKKIKLFKVQTLNFSNRIEILLEDNGLGFDGDLGFLMEPFVTKRNDDGIGLGLFIVTELVKGMNGEVVIDNDSSLCEGSARVRLILYKKEICDENR
ncbi:MAG: sensor histidine kinase [Erysipelotrichales bacterium]|nr:sensor histidine kinase [Erysipelotrichales bacterium]